MMTALINLTKKNKLNEKYEGFFKKNVKNFLLFMKNLGSVFS